MKPCQHNHEMQMYITMFFVLRFFGEKYLKIKHFGCTSLFNFFTSATVLQIVREKPAKCTK